MTPRFYTPLHRIMGAKYMLLSVIDVDIDSYGDTGITVI